MYVISLLAGFALLFVGGELLVRGAVGIARRLQVSPLVIGATVVGFGTSAPELVVSLEAALIGAPGIAVGNVVGSNLANMMLILALVALIAPVAVRRDAVRRDGLAMLAATALFVVIALGGAVNRPEAAAMLALLAGYVALSLWWDRARPGPAAELRRGEAETFADGVPRALWFGLVAAAAGLAALIAGAQLFVAGAVQLARALAVAEEVIGLSLVAVGTSLPELATALTAARRGQPELALGNVLGSNIFNLLGILGAAGLVVTVPVAPRIVAFDVWVLLGVSALMVAMMLSGWRVSRREGAMLLAGYAAYLALLYAAGA